MLSNGDKVGPYTIRESVGQGGMATVYKAWHEGLHRFEALKVPRGAHGGEPDSAYIQRLLAEARTAAGLHHPNIVAIHGVSEPMAPIPFFAMDWVDGRDLAKILAEKRNFSIAQTIQILESVASALDYAHERGVVHRDIKPANILIGQNNGVFVPRVVDFGISRAAEDEDGEGATKLTKSGMIVGTPEYMSPEQAGSGDVIDYRTDIYSLAVVAYEMLSGSPPFTAGAGVSRLSILISHVRDRAPLFDKCPDFPRGAGEVILRALSKAPQDRPVSCGAFLVAFKAALQPGDMSYIGGSCQPEAVSSAERTPFDSSRFEPVDGATLYELPATPVGAPQTITPHRSAPVTAVEPPTGSSSVYSLRARLEAAAATPPASRLPQPTQISAPSSSPVAAAPPRQEPEAWREPLGPGVPASESLPLSKPLQMASSREDRPRGGSRMALMACIGGIVIGASLVFAFSSRVSQGETSVATPQSPIALQPSGASIQNKKPSLTVAATSSEKPVISTPRLRTVRQTRTRPIDFPTITQRSSSRPLGSRYVSQRGQKGNRELIIAVTYQGAKEVTRRVESDRVIKEPVSQVVVLGTRQIVRRTTPVDSAPEPVRPRVRQVRRTSEEAPKPRSQRRVVRQVRKTAPRVIAAKTRARTRSAPRRVREAPLPP